MFSDHSIVLVANDSHGSRTLIRGSCNDCFSQLMIDWRLFSMEWEKMTSLPQPLVMCVFHRCLRQIGPLSRDFKKNLKNSPVYCSLSCAHAPKIFIRVCIVEKKSNTKIAQVLSYVAATFCTIFWVPRERLFHSSNPTS